MARQKKPHDPLRWFDSSTKHTAFAAGQRLKRQVLRLDGDVVHDGSRVSSWSHGSPPFRKESILTVGYSPDSRHSRWSRQPAKKRTSGISARGGERTLDSSASASLAREAPRPPANRR